MEAYDEYQWMEDDGDRAVALRELAEAMATGSGPKPVPRTR
jgi:hypothetical protein